MHDDEQEFFPDTIEECEAEIEQLEEENRNIAAQVELYDSGLVRGSKPNWRKSAMGAMIHRQRTITELKEHIEDLGGEPAETVDPSQPSQGQLNQLQDQINSMQANFDRAKEANRNANEQMRKQKQRHVEAIDSIQRALNRQAYVCSMVMAFIAEKHPHILDAAHAVRSLAEAEYDAKTTAVAAE